MWQGPILTPVYSELAPLHDDSDTLHCTGVCAAFPGSGSYSVCELGGLLFYKEDQISFSF